MSWTGVAWVWRSTKEPITIEDRVQIGIEAGCITPEEGAKFISDIRGKLDKTAKAAVYRELNVKTREIISTDKRFTVWTSREGR